MVIWNLDTLDWYFDNETASVAHVMTMFDQIKKLKGQDPSSLILLSHDLWTLNSLTSLVPYFKNKGYQYFHFNFNIRPDNLMEFLYPKVKIPDIKLVSLGGEI